MIKTSWKLFALGLAFSFAAGSLAEESRPSVVDCASVMRVGEKTGLVYYPGQNEARILPPIRRQQLQGVPPELFMEARRKLKEMLGDEYNPAEHEAELIELLQSRQVRNWFRRENTALKALTHEMRDHQAMPVKVKAIHERQASLLARVFLIRRARETIDMTYFIFGKDTPGLMLLAELKAAVRRGVHVNIQADWIGNMMEHQGFSHFKAFLEWVHSKGFSERVNVIQFNPSTHFAALLGDVGRGNFNRISRLLNRALGTQIPMAELNKVTLFTATNKRSHDKIVFIDAHSPERAMAFIGGSNIKKLYFQDPTNVDYRGNQISHADNDIIVSNLPGIHSNFASPLILWYRALHSELGNRVMSPTVFSRLYKAITGRSLYERENRGMDAAPFEVARYQDGLAEFGLTPNDFQALGMVDRDGHLRSSASSSERARIQRRIDDYFEKNWSLSLFDPAYTIDNTQKENLFKWVTNPVHRRKMERMRANRNDITRQIHQALQHETEEITVISPYLTFKDTEIWQIRRWLAQDPRRKFRVITGSMYTTDMPHIQTWLEFEKLPKLMDFAKPVSFQTGQRRYIDPSQIEVFEYGRLNDSRIDPNSSIAYGLMHMKGVIGKSSGVIAVGTFNGDYRSRVINSELMALLQSPRRYLEQYPDAPWADELRAFMNDPERQRQAGVDLQIDYFDDFVLKKLLPELISHCHLYGSEEWAQLRDYEMYPDLYPDQKGLKAKVVDGWRKIVRSEKPMTNKRIPYIQDPEKQIKKLKRKLPIVGYPMYILL